MSVGAKVIDTMNQIKQRTAIAEYLGYIDVREYVVDMDDDCLR